MSLEGRKAFFLSRVPSRWLLLMVLLLAGIVWFGFYATHTKEIAGSDDREYVSIARNIVNGKGIVRNFVYPVDINYFEKAPVPEFVHPPGYPLILAGFFKLFGVRDGVALLPSYLSFFILILLLFLFAKTYLDIKTATLAAVILIFNREILDMSLVALSEEVYTLFFFLFFILFVKARSLRAIFIAGLLLGISHLIRENMFPFLFPLFAYLYFYPDLPRWKKLVFFSVGLLIPILPNLIRSYSETGTPFFSYGKFALMAYTDKYPWVNIFREIENPSLVEFLIEEPNQFFSKYINNLSMTVESLLSISNLYLLAFFLVEMFYWKISSEWKRVKSLFLLLLVSQVFFISLFTFTHRFFIFFLPMMILFASQSYLRVSEALLSDVKNQWRKGVSYLAICLFLIFFTAPAIHIMLKPGRYPLLDLKIPPFGFLMQKHEAMALNEFLNRELKENQIVWTDLPEILEWEGDRLCGWLPPRIKMIYEIRRKIPVDAILLTSLRTPHRMEEEWRYLLFSEHSLPQYRSVRLYKGNTVFAKLLIWDDKE